MKKFFLVLMAAGAMTACNNEASTDGDVKDSVQKTIDSIGDARVDSVKEATDSLQQKVENTFSATDSANKALADSASKKQ
jgi:signal transduction histidine kinase